MPEAESIGPVTMDGPVSGLEFRSMTGVEQLSQPFRYDLEFLSDSATLAPTAFIGERLTVMLELVVTAAAMKVIASTGSSLGA